jgi:hypothetical protein
VGVNVGGLTIALARRSGCGERASDVVLVDGAESSGNELSEPRDVAVLLSRASITFLLGYCTLRPISSKISSCEPSGRFAISAPMP